MNRFGKPCRLKQGRSPAEPARTARCTPMQRGRGLQITGQIAPILKPPVCRLRPGYFPDRLELAWPRTAVERICCFFLKWGSVEAGFRTP